MVFGRWRECINPRKFDEDATGSQSQLCGGAPETGSGSLFGDSAVKLAPAATFDGDQLD
jgi:hypothetical protein